MDFTAGKSTEAAKACLAAAVSAAGSNDAAAAVMAEKNWRANYWRHFMRANEVFLASPEACVSGATAGLEAMREAFSFHGQTLGSVEREYQQGVGASGCGGGGSVDLAMWQRLGGITGGITGPPAGKKTHTAVEMEEPMARHTPLAPLGSAVVAGEGAEKPFSCPHYDGHEQSIDELVDSMEVCIQHMYIYPLCTLYIYTFTTICTPYVHHTYT